MLNGDQWGPGDWAGRPGGELWRTGRASSRKSGLRSHRSSRLDRRLYQVAQLPGTATIRRRVRQYSFLLESQKEGTQLVALVVHSRIKTLLSSFLLLYILIFPKLSVGSDKNLTVLVDGGGFDCLPISTFGLKGIRLWQSEDTVVTILGRPQSITYGWGEDDGGRYDVKTYHYSDVEIDIVRGNVDRIYTKSNKVSMPSGIRVGHTAKQVIQILGRKPRDWQGTRSEFSIVTCPEKGVWIQEDYVTLKFDGDGMVQSIEYAANRP